MAKGKQRYKFDIKKGVPIFLRQEEKSLRTRLLWYYAIFLLCFTILYFVTSSVYHAELPSDIPDIQLYDDKIKAEICLISLNNDIEIKYPSNYHLLNNISQSDKNYLLNNSDIDNFLLKYKDQCLSNDKNLAIFILLNMNKSSKITLGHYQHAYMYYQISNINEIDDYINDFLDNFPQIENPLLSDNIIDYTLSLTLLNPEPYTYNWDVTNAISLYLKPFLKNLKPLIDFEIDSQVLFLANITNSNNIEFNEKLQQYELDTSHLQSFFLKSNLNRVSPMTLSSLELMVYISPYNLPLVFKETKYINQKQIINYSNSFVIAEWGSVVILNINDKNLITNNIISTTLLKPTFLEINHLLRYMLGLEYTIITRTIIFILLYFTNQ